MGQTVSVFGLGYVGLPTAAAIANCRIRVVGVDIKTEIVDNINEGKAHFVEPGLDILLAAAVQGGMLRATTRPEPADVFVIAVPTPLNSEMSADVTRVEQAARNIAKVIKKGDLVIVESTSPVGTTSAVCRWLNSERPELKLPDQNQDCDIFVAYCPERILPGRTVFELVENDRIIGGITPACAKRAEDFYRNFVRGRISTTDAATAELVKLAENAFRDVNIAFANELSMICDSLSLDIWEAINLANQHPRVNILKPGAGVGGHCTATDPWFLIDAAREDARLLQTARAVNDNKREHITELVRSRISEFERRPVVACLGLAYKPDIDDLRESPALRITLTLAEEQADILVVEPHLPALPSSLADFPNVALVDLGTAVSSADVVVVLVGHSAFRDLDWGSLSEPRIVDAVGIRHETQRARREPIVGSSQTFPKTG